MRWMVIFVGFSSLVALGGCRRGARNVAGNISMENATATGQTIFAASITEGQARAAILRALQDLGFTPTLDAVQQVEGVWSRRNREVWARITYTATGCSITLEYSEPERERLVERRMNSIMAAVTSRIEEESRRVVVAPNTVQATVTVTPGIVAPPAAAPVVIVEGSYAAQ